MSTEEIIYLTILLTLLAVFLISFIYKEISEFRKAELEQKDIKKINDRLSFLEEIRQVVREELNAQNEKSQDKQSE